MNIRWLACLGSLVIFAPLASADGVHDCPVLRYVGEIEAIDGPAGEVQVIRGSNRIIARRGQCLLYGDKVKAGSHAIVDIVTAGMNYRIGRHQASPSWTAPDAPHEPDPGWLGRIQSAFELLMSSSDWSSLGIGRGGSSSCRALVPGSGQPIAPLDGLPTVPQKVGADLTNLVVAWKRGSGFWDVSIRLSHPDGKVVVTEHVCQRSHVSVAVPRGALRAGDFLVLEARDIGGARLEWKIDVVAPEKLPQPEEPARAPWLLGAWRLVETGAEFKLDAVSRLSSGAEQSFAAQRFLDAVFSNRVF